MKKATLLTFLFAVLMIALLVSCNASPDPLPDETTTDGAAEEPTDVTSDEAEASEPVETTTEEVTTEELSTETTMKMPEWDTSGVIDKMFLIPITDAGETEPPSDEPITLPETDTPWYITEWETSKEIETFEIPAEKQNLAIRFPGTAEYVCEDLKIRVNTFQEYYRLGDPIQIRYTVETQTNELFTIRAEQKWPVVIRNEERNVLKIATLYFPEDPPHRFYNRKMYLQTGSCLVYVYPGAYPGETCPRDTFENGVVSFEHMILADPSFFDAGEVYELLIQIEPQVSGGRGCAYYVKIPLEIVEYESVSP